MMNDRKSLSITNDFQEAEYFADLFEKDLPAGGVIGNSSAGNGIVRNGIDVENVISIDHGALRIEPMLKAGWGQTGIAYGPYQRKNGLTLAVSILNGHNTSQTGSLRQSLKRRFYDWAYGSHADGLLTRGIQWIRYRRKKRTFRLWRRWWQVYAEERNGGIPAMDENLAIGWFPHEVPSDPRKEGSAFIVHATGALNGELRSTIASGISPLIRGLQNIPLYYIIVLREQGAVYYAASVPDTPYLPVFPKMRPLAIEPYNNESPIYAGLFQSVLGQIGFRADTRVREFHVTHLSQLDTWYGTAHIADRLSGEELLSDQVDETNKHWFTSKGNFERTSQGCKPIESENMAVIFGERPSGLIHLLIKIGDQLPESFTLIWRYTDYQNYFFWEFQDGCNQLKSTQRGETRTINQDETLSMTPNATHSLQVVDDGNSIWLYLDGQLVFGDTVIGATIEEGLGIGFGCCGQVDDFFLASIEAHPRELDIPDGLNLLDQWTHSQERKIVIQDDFRGNPTDELAGRETPVGKQIWQKDIGYGKIGLQENDCAMVIASIYQPNPGRTVYTVPWDNENYADLELDFIPPDTGPLEYEKSRVGLIFYQDANNYITVSTFVDDYYDGSSIAFFYRLNGFEEIYDAIWSNVGREIGWGVLSCVRVVFDRLNFAILINGKAVCYRSLQDVYPDLQDFYVTRVGIVVNWEWGNDTGTVIRRFSAAE